MSMNLQLSMHTIVRGAAFTFAVLLVAAPAMVFGQDADELPTPGTPPNSPRERAGETRQALQENLQERKAERTERIEEQSQMMEERREERQERIVEVRENASATRAQIQERVQTLKERSRERIENSVSMIADRMDRLVNRLEQIRERIGSRSEKVNERGGDTTDAENALATADTLIKTARAQIAELRTLTTEVLGSESPRDRFVEIREAAQGIKEAIRSIHSALRDAVVALGTAMENLSPEPAENVDESEGEAENADEEVTGSTGDEPAEDE